MSHVRRTALVALFTALSAALFATPANAQLATTVGPDVVPQGAQLSVTLSNDQPHLFGCSVSWLRVQNSAGQFVYNDTSFEISVTFGPHGWISFYWDLTDDQGQPLPPGPYRAHVKSDQGAPTTVHRFEIVASGAGLVFEGTPTIHPPFGGGLGRNFLLQSPTDGGLIYFLLAAQSSLVGVPTCNGTFPLDPDPLLLFTLTPNTLIGSSFGQLSANGTSSAPRFNLPQDPSLVGIQLETAFIVLDPADPTCIVRRISNVEKLTIVG